MFLFCFVYQNIPVSGQEWGLSHCKDDDYVVTENLATSYAIPKHTQHFESKIILFQNKILSLLPQWPQTETKTEDWDRDIFIPISFPRLKIPVQSNPGLFCYLFIWSHEIITNLDLILLMKLLQYKTLTETTQQTMFWIAQIKAVKYQYLHSNNYCC